MSGFSMDRRALLAGLAVGTMAPRAFAQSANIRIKPERELMVPVEGGKIYVRVNGNLNGPRPPLLYMHGGPGGSHNGQLPLTEMAGDRAIILYDQLDSGRSDTPQDPKNWRVSRFVDEIDHIRDALGIKHWHVGGGSWGGTLALEYGARRRPELQSSIIQSPLVSTKAWIADAERLRKQLPPQTQATLTACESKAPPAAAACDAATKDYYAEHVRRSKGPGDPALMAYAKNQPRKAPRTLYQQMWGPSEFRATGSLINYDGEPLLAKLDGKKTLFVCGEFDEATPQTVSAFARRVPGSTFKEIKGSAHSIFTDQPVAYLAVLRQWMAAHDKV
jgi:L-proline amide hydrolase